MNWVGYDPDGRVDHYLIAVDPTAPTRSRGRVLAPDQHDQERADHLLSKPRTRIRRQGSRAPTSTTPSRSRRWTTRVRCRNRCWRTFFSYTQAPTVFIDARRPTPSSRQSLSTNGAYPLAWDRSRRAVHDQAGEVQVPAVRAAQPGLPGDPRFRLVLDFESDFIRNVYAPTFGPSDLCPTCTAWDSSSAETTGGPVHQPDSQPVLRVRGDGLRRSRRLRPDLLAELEHAEVLPSPTPARAGRRSACSTTSSTSATRSGGYANDPTRYFNLEVPAGQPVTFFWIAIPPPGAGHAALPLGARPAGPGRRDAAHQRADRLGSLEHLQPSEHHRDNRAVLQQRGETICSSSRPRTTTGSGVSGIIHFTVVAATFERDILFVDDTRLTPDQDRVRDQPAQGRETERHLALGRGARHLLLRQGVATHGRDYPAGSLSPRGIFDGYPFRTDVLPPTRSGRAASSAGSCRWRASASTSSWCGTPMVPGPPTPARLRRSSSPSPRCVT